MPYNRIGDAAEQSPAQSPQSATTDDDQIGGPFRRDLRYDFAGHCQTKRPGAALSAVALQIGGIGSGAQRARGSNQETGHLPFHIQTLTNHFGLTVPSNTFFTRVDGKRADVAVVNGPNGKYVRTHADGVWNDNLLALRECR